MRPRSSIHGAHRGVAPIIPISVALIVGGAFGVGFLASYIYNQAPWCPLSTSISSYAPPPGHDSNNSSSDDQNGSVVFSARASGCVAPYGVHWNFGDGTTSSSWRLVHVFPGPGVYSGSVTISDSAGHHSISYLCTWSDPWPYMEQGSTTNSNPCSVLGA